MQNDRSQDRRSPFDLFSDFENIGGFGGSIFERNPFDDPFFTTRPFDSTFNHSSLVGGPHLATPPSEPLIQELDSDDDDGRDNEDKEVPKSSTKLSKAPFVNHPDDESDDGQKGTNSRTNYKKADGTQSRTFKVESCKVICGGVDGVYYSSSSTRRMGSDGVIMEECKEADKSKGQATHRISRGLHDKGHSVTRKLNPDGKVDTLQTLHNLSEDELGNFEEAWRSNSGNHLPSWTGPRDSPADHISNSSLLPSTRNMGSLMDTGHNNETRADPCGGRSRKVVRIPVE